MFDYLPVGLGLLIIGLIFLRFGYRLLPANRRGAPTMGEVLDVQSYVTEAKVVEGSPAIGLRIDEFTQRHDNEVTVTAMLRSGIRSTTFPDAVIREDDTLILGGALTGWIVGRVMLRLMTLNFIRTGVFAPLLLLLPAYTSEALGAGPGVGTAMLVCMGIGGVIATFIMSSWGFLTKKGLVSLITLVSGSAVITSLGISHWIWYSVPIMVIMGLSQSHFIVANQTLVQNIVPDTLRGRVSSVWHYEQGLIPLFSGMIGLVATQIGISWALICFGGAALCLSVLFIIRFGDIRSLD